MKYFILLLIVAGIVSCKNSKIIIHLEKESRGFNHFFFSYENDYNNLDSILAKSVVTDSFGVFSVSLHVRQSYHNLLKQNKIDTVHFQYLSLNDDSPIDTSGKLKYATRFFFGKRSNGDFLFIPDQNNNGDFVDDKQFLFKANRGSQVYREYLKIDLYNIEGYDGKSVKKYTIPIVVEFYISSLFSNSYFVLIGGERWSGGYSFAGKKYSLKIGRANIPGAPDKNNLSFSLQIKDSATALKRYLFTNRKIDEKFYMNEKAWEIKKLKLYKSKAILVKSKESMDIEKKAPQVSYFIGKNLPEIKLDNIGINNSSLKGKVVLINFWFANCEPCINEIPLLNELYNTYSKSNDFLFLSFTFEPESVINIVRKKNKLSYPVYSIPREECFRLSRSMFYPTTIVLNKSTTICYYFNGEINRSAIDNRYSYDVLKNMIKELLEKKG
jgi:thiol-disulfide isomerase/thioredoxin